MDRMKSVLIEPLEIRRLLSSIAQNVVPDSSFGLNGSAGVDGSALIKQFSDGSIITVGGTSATRLEKDGTVDPGFTDRGATSAALDDEQAVIDDKQILIAGKVPYSDNYIVRAISVENGLVVTSFGTNGTFTTALPAFSAHTTVYDEDLTSMIVTSDGGILLSFTQDLVPKSGAASGTPSAADAFYKLTPGGQLDSSFGNGGIDIYSTSQAQGFASMVALSNGRFLDLRITATDGTSTIERRLNDGALDTSFGDNGQASINLVGAGLPTYIGPVIQSDGKIVYAINDNQDSGTLGYVARLNSNGSPDATFGNGGGVKLGVGAVSHLAVDSSDQIVGVFANDLFRLNGNGTLDTNFDDDGFAALDVSYPGYMTTDSANRILISGGGSTAKVSRYTQAQSVLLEENDILQIAGSDDADSVVGTISKNVVTIDFDGRGYNFSANKIAGIAAYLGDGNDRIDLSALNIPATIYGGDGNDHIVTGDGSQSLYGDAGADRLYGGSGSDLLSGGGGNDILYGQMGKDRLYGGNGRDHLYGGGGDDRLFGGAGGDSIYAQNGNDQLNGQGGPDHLYAANSIGSSTLHGNAGNDVFVTDNGVLDYVFGDGGIDTAFADQIDVLTSIEHVSP